MKSKWNLAAIEGMALLAVLLIGAASGLAQSGLHRFGSILSQPDRPTTFKLLGEVPSTFLNYFDIYPIAASTNLTSWTQVRTMVRTNASTNALVFLDTNATAFVRSFYRTATNRLCSALAQPSGSYSVGRTTRMLTDPSRTNRYGIATNSSFMITIWYPAQPAPNKLPAAYIDPQIAAPLAESHVGSTGDDAARLGGFFAFSQPDIPAATAGAPYPVVIYSHGYTFHRQESAEKLEQLASHGFVTVAMDHADCRSTVYPDGRVVRGNFSDPYTESDLTKAVTDRLADDQSVLQSLAQLNLNDPILAGRFDLTRLGAMGWSLGNSDMGELAQTDVRFKGIVMLEGYLPGAPGLLDQLLQHGWRLPVLALYHDDPSTAPMFNQAVTNATNDAYFSLMHISSHFAFKDLTEVSLATEPIRSGAAAMRACMLSFFNKYLKGQDDHLLDAPTNQFPVLFNYVRK